MGAAQKTILIVDPQAGERHKIRAILDDAGYSVVSAKSIEEAAEIFGAQKGSIDLVISRVEFGDGVLAFRMMERFQEIQPSVKYLLFSYYPAPLLQHLPEFGRHAGRFLPDRFTAEALACIGSALAA